MASIDQCQVYVTVAVWKDTGGSGGGPVQEFRSEDENSSLE
jgi:hypothetical protein